MAKGVHGGGVDFPIRATSEQLRSDLEQGKQMVRQAAQEMRATANVSVAGSADLGPAAASSTFDANVQAKMRRMQELSARRAENARIAAAARRNLGMVTASEAQGLMMSRHGPAMEDIEAAGRWEARAQRRMAAMAGAGPGGSGNALYSSTFAAVAALTYLTKSVMDTAIQIRQASAMFGFQQSRLAGIAGRQTAFGIGGENVGIAFDMKAATAEHQLNREMIHQNAPFAFVRNWVRPNDLFNAQVAAQLANEEAQLTQSALRGQGRTRVRSAQVRGGDIAAFKQQQMEELRDIRMNRAKFPGNVALLDLENQTVDAQAGELDLAMRQEGARRRGIMVGAGITELRGAEMLATKRGAGFAAFATQRKALELQMEQTFEERLARTVKQDEIDVINRERQQARFNFRLETEIGARDLSLRRSGRAGDVAEAGLFGRLNRERYWGEQQNFGSMADNAMRMLTEALKLNTEAIKNRGGWDE